MVPLPFPWGCTQGHSVLGSPIWAKKVILYTHSWTTPALDTTEGALWGVPEHPSSHSVGHAWTPQLPSLEARRGLAGV